MTGRTEKSAGAAPQGLGTFTRVWLGQFVSTLGSGLSAFALSVWVYETTGSTSLFALTSLALVLPSIALLPVSGVLADRWNRRTVMLLSDAGGLLTALAAAALFARGGVKVWHVFVINLFITTIDALRSPAWNAAISTLVPTEELGRANGMMQSAQATVQVVVPLAAGVLLAALGVHGVLFIDAATFAFALLTLYRVRMPNPERSGADAGHTSMRQDLVEGWRYLRERSGLVNLLALGFALTLVMVMAQVSLTPMVLAASSATVLGTISSVGGLGMLGGSFLLSAWKSPPRRVDVLLAFSALSGASLLAFALVPPGPLLALPSLVYLFCMPLIYGSTQVIWQRKVPQEFQGRLFALRNVAGLAATPLAFLLVGALVDPWLEPLMRPDGALTASVGRLIGVGQGRGAALLLLMLGVLLMALALGAAWVPRLRRMEEQLPDAVLPGLPPQSEAPAPDVASEPHA